MDYATYEVESQVEATHWWFVGRRKLFGRIIKTFDLSPTANVLDIGTSTGTNLRMLRDLGYCNVRGLDLHEEAIRWCADKGLGLVDLGDICNIPAPESVYDLVMATDIIEHVDNDDAALCEIARVLKPGGFAIVTVPAFQSLWGLQDTVSHHKRRYRKHEVVNKLHKAELVVDECFYFNYLLFLPIWLARKIIRLLGLHLSSENEINSKILNKLLSQIFSIDVATARMISPPFGVSALAVVRKAIEKKCEGGQKDE
jgi:SAM-dependent methyltransferase